MGDVTSEFTTTSSVVEAVTVTFSGYDYAIFTTMLAVSVLIGLYFGCFGSKQSTASEYLMGSKEMKMLPIAVSLVASHTSGITILGVPADVYRYGAGYWLCVIGYCLVSLATAFIYLPVFFKAKITSVYEYLGKRFDEKTRIFSSFLFAVSQILFLPIVIYIPALAFAAATGINLHLITPIICGVCIFYTSIGGLKAVVWTDNVQFTIALGAISAVLVLGIKATGGFAEIWRRAIEGHRLDIFDFDPDVTKRDNFWALLLGYTTLQISLTNTNQGCVQKFLSVATIREAKLSAICYCLGMSIVKTACVVTGLIIFARYSDCDPFVTHQIKRNDQLLPYYVLDVAGKIPGLSGLFTAGVFSAGLSTLSAHLNCLSGTIYEDFVSRWMPHDISERSKSNILKLIVVISGVVCTTMVFVFEHLGGILALALSFGGLTAGPLLGMFTLGVMFRRANAKGAFYGGILGMSMLSALVLPAKYLQSNGFIHYPTKPVSTNACSFNFSMSETVPEIEEGGVLAVFKISYYYYALMGCIITMVSGLIISYCTEMDKKPLDEDLLSPMVQSLEYKLKYQEEKALEYNTVQKALNLVIYNSENESDLKV